MATVIPASPLDWLPAVQQQLVTVTGLPIERVIFSINPVPGRMASTQDVLVWPGEVRSFGSIALGSGRVAPVVIRDLQILIRTRLAEDQSESDQSLLLDPALGHFQMEDLVMGAMYDFQPIDINQNALLACPLEFSGGPKPFKPTEIEIPDLGQSIVTYLVTYVHKQSAVHDGVNL